MKYDLFMTLDARPEINLLDGEFYVNSPYETFAWMRANEPIFWDATNKLWGISRYDDIVAIERDKKRFISNIRENPSRMHKSSNLSNNE